MTRKIDATRPFYAVVGAGDLAAEYARTYATDVQTRFANVELEPKALRDQARTIFVGRVDDLTKDAKEAQAKLESFTNETVAELTETYGDLAARGKLLVNRIRKQQSTKDAKAAGKTTVAKAKTAKTQTVKSAAAAKKTASSATKATGTSAKKAASATIEAVADGAAKIGN
jgi:heparin binding hemagglutinin HbhA